MVRLTLILLLLLPQASSAAQKVEVKITLPTEGTLVPWRPCLEGFVTDPMAKVVVVVRSLETGDDFFVQPPITVRQTGKFRVQIYIAKQSRVYAGQHFEIRAFANAKEPLHETTNDPLSAWPKSEAASEVVEVVRDDSAATGCGQTDSSGPAHSSPTVEDSARPNDGHAHQPKTAEKAEYPRNFELQTVKRPYPSELFVFGIPLLLLLFWFILAWLPKRTDDGQKTLREWLSQANKWLWGLGPRAIQSVRSCARYVFGWSRTAQSRIWRLRGYEGDLKGLSQKGLAIPILFLFFWFALYADAIAILSGLPLIFPTMHSQRVGAIGSLLASRPTDVATPSQSAIGEGQVNDTETTQGKSRYLRLAKDLVSQAVHPFKAIWQEATLGFMAVGLAAIQAALGLAFMWGISTEKCLDNGVTSFIRQRPILFTCFLVFDLGLGLLAGNRGFELGTGESIWIPAALSCVIGLVTPWIQAYTLHLCLDCVSDCLGVLTACMVRTSVLVLASVSVLAWTLVLAVTGITATVVFLLCNSLWFAVLFLFSAEVFGEFVRELRRCFLGERDRAPKPDVTARTMDYRPEHGNRAGFPHDGRSTAILRS